MGRAGQRPRTKQTHYGRKPPKGVIDGNMYLGALFIGVKILKLNGMAELAMTIKRLPIFFLQQAKGAFSFTRVGPAFFYLSFKHTNLASRDGCIDWVYQLWYWVFARSKLALLKHFMITHLPGLGSPTTSSIEEIDSYLKERQVAIQTLKGNLVKAQERMKYYADKGAWKTNQRMEIHLILTGMVLVATETVLLPA